LIAVGRSEIEFDYINTTSLTKHITLDYIRGIECFQFRSCLVIGQCHKEDEGGCPTVCIEILIHVNIALKEESGQLGSSILQNSERPENRFSLIQLSLDALHWPSSRLIQGLRKLSLCRLVGKLNNHVVLHRLLEKYYLVCSSVTNKILIQYILHFTFKEL